MQKYLEIIQRQLQTLNENLDRKQKIRIAIFAVLLIIIIVVAVVLLNRTEYTVLFSRLDQTEASEIYEILVAEGVPVQTSNNDTTISVPVDRAESLRMSLLSQGYPSSGFQYEYNLDSGMGSTNETQKTLYKTNLQEHLRKTIRQMNRIADVAVIIHLETDNAFVLAQNQKPAQASVLLELDGEGRISDAEARTIANLVRTAVPNLKEENITIADTYGNTYKITDEELLADAGTQQALIVETQNRFEEAIRTLLVPIFGEGHAIPSVYVELDFSKKITESREVSSPEGAEEGKGLAIAIEETAEKIYGSTAEGQVGLSNNGGTAPTYETIFDDDNLYAKASRKVNYDLNEIKEQIQNAQGTIEKITASVLIDANQMQEVDYSDDVRGLVAMALGGILPENIQVSSIPFIEDTSGQALLDSYLEGIAAMEQGELIRMIILAAAILLSALLIFLMVRSIMQSRRAREMADLAAAEAAAQAEVAALAIEDMPVSEEQEMLDAISAKRDETTMRIEEFIERDPAAAAHLLRGWLTDE